MKKRILDVNNDGFIIIYVGFYSKKKKVKKNEKFLKMHSST